ncbi:protein kinase [Lusitaniella coriacea LEGE 07157]|uniref:Protein kinase n=1 Tax=Lusitaniella coriacea LEGE 07157 TaxID=945747 RepID=A0A8J7DWM3_9CYAN|nr:type IV pilin-like G/H family protein [Lusitaniella coriacea]MBE9116427.1 protein kinase [Lusitaniella coriacea LEGE 07157]
MLKSQQVVQNRYRLQQQLSENPTRQTWLAEDIESEQQVIVKLLPFSPQTQWQEIKLFEREAQVLKHISRPQIPHYLDYFSIEKEEGGGLPWFALVQEYIPGKSLQQLLKEDKSFTEAEAKDIARQLLAILIDLHELSPPILHRDIKPSNLIALSGEVEDSHQSKVEGTGNREQGIGNSNQLIVQENSEQSSPRHLTASSTPPASSAPPAPPTSHYPSIYLVDFGAVQDRAKAEGVTFTVVGTGGYSPPEQLWGKAVAASDLYALGATLVHLLTGIAPGDLPQHRMRLQFRDKVSLSPEFARWLDKLLDPAVEKRFTQARQALEALEATEKVKILEKASFLRLGGLALIQYGVVGLCALALPLFAAYRYTHEGKINVGSMNRAQQAYVIEKNEFTDSIEELGISVKEQTENYTYNIQKTPLFVFNYAISRKPGLNNYLGIVALIPMNSPADELLTVPITCEAERQKASYLIDPRIANATIECPPGTIALNGSQEGIIIENENGKLAYNALESAIAGQLDKALETAETITNQALKARTLVAIAPHLKTPQQRDRAMQLAETIKKEESQKRAIDTIQKR